MQNVYEMEKVKQISQLVKGHSDQASNIKSNVKFLLVAFYLSSFQTLSYLQDDTSRKDLLHLKSNTLHTPQYYK